MRYSEIIRENFQDRFGKSRYKIIPTKPTPKSTFRSERKKIEVHPNDHEHGTVFMPRPGRYPNRVSYYDPELSDIVDRDEDDPIMHLRFAQPKSHLSTEIEPLPESNIMYRGVSYEEYEAFLKNGYIKSLGEYNFENQKNLTYWATNPQTAVSYANSFAPTQFKPTFTKPAFVFAAPKPSHTVHVKGTGDNEIGVPVAITKDQIVAIWKGKVYEFTPGEYELFRHHPDYPSIESDEPDHPEKLGGGISPTASVVWERIL